jgi:hypothetical protein
MGRRPERTVNVTGRTPPLVLTVARYDRPILAPTSRVVTSTSLGYTMILRSTMDVTPRLSVTASLSGKVPVIAGMPAVLIE